ncbi:MAG: hypothetical protein UEP57_08210 [Oscillospiraceae bacterium]|nr:hypothetical protein [Oscillospiraceae bacterium]
MTQIVIAVLVAAMTRRFHRLDLRLEAGAAVRVDNLDAAEVDHLTKKYGRRVAQTTRQGREYITLI